MGSMTAGFLANDIKSGLATIEQAVAIHMQSNCFPPFPMSLLPVAVKAIQRYKAGDQTRITLPDGILFHGQRSIYPSVCIKAMRLHAFVQDNEDEGSEE